LQRYFLGDKDIKKLVKISQNASKNIFLGGWLISLLSVLAPCLAGSWFILYLCTLQIFSFGYATNT